MKWKEGKIKVRKTDQKQHPERGEPGDQALSPPFLSPTVWPVGVLLLSAPQFPHPQNEGLDDMTSEGTSNSDSIQQQDPLYPYDYYNPSNGELFVFKQNFVVCKTCSCSLSHLILPETKLEHIQTEAVGPFDRAGSCHLYRSQNDYLCMHLEYCLIRHLMTDLT